MLRVMYRSVNMRDVHVCMLCREGRKRQIGVISGAKCLHLTYGCSSQRCAVRRPRGSSSVTSQWEPTTALTVPGKNRKSCRPSGRLSVHQCNVGHPLFPLQTPFISHCNIQLSHFSYHNVTVNKHTRKSIIYYFYPAPLSKNAKCTCEN